MSNYTVFRIITGVSLTSRSIRKGSVRKECGKIVREQVRTVRGQRHNSMGEPYITIATSLLHRRALRPPAVTIPPQGHSRRRIRLHGAGGRSYRDVCVRPRSFASHDVQRLFVAPVEVDVRRQRQRRECRRVIGILRQTTAYRSVTARTRHVLCQRRTFNTSCVLGAPMVQDASESWPRFRQVDTRNLKAGSLRARNLVGIRRRAGIRNLKAGTRNEGMRRVGIRRRGVGAGLGVIIRGDVGGGIERA